MRQAVIFQPTPEHFKAGIAVLGRLARLAPASSTFGCVCDLDFHLPPKNPLTARRQGGLFRFHKVKGERLVRSSLLILNEYSVQFVYLVHKVFLKLSSFIQIQVCGHGDLNAFDSLVLANCQNTLDHDSSLPGMDWFLLSLLSLNIQKVARNGQEIISAKRFDSTDISREINSLQKTKGIKEFILR